MSVLTHRMSACAYVSALPTLVLADPHIMMYSMTIFASLLGSALGFATVPPMKMGIPCSTEVKVTVTVSDTWCEASHPHDFVDNLGGDGPINGPFTPNSDPPVKAGAHISPTLVYTHGGDTPAWGVNATQGVAKVLKVCLVSVAPQLVCCPPRPATRSPVGWTLYRLLPV
jgi:hypothetical protein